MKIRIRGNTLRLRLKRGEVDRIASGRSIVEKTHFPGSVLTYRLGISDEGTFAASFDGGDLTIGLPGSQVTQWAQTDQVSMVAEQPVGGARILSLLVEKDFQCLAPGDHRPCGDDVDTFPHPDAH